jgi:hypothetical protein
VIRPERERKLAAEVRYLRERRGFSFGRIASRLRLVDDEVARNAYHDARR